MKSRIRRLTVPLVLLAGLVTLAAFALPAVGLWLVVADALVPSDAIIVLDGRTPARELGAASLYHARFAPVVVLARPRDIVGEIPRRLAGLPTSQEHAAQVLRHVRVPDRAIVRATEIADNTEQELSIDFELARARGFRRVIMVTSPSHTRRVKTIWRPYDDRVQGLVYPTPWERFPAERWWQSRKALETTVHELFGLLNLALGSPLTTFDRDD
ncbi:MAG: YdcF family protein [Candidatus Rokubacteria bacterium]|nr:YdcF family protein [Candidatus Rokubacteria bacterium]